MKRWIAVAALLAAGILGGWQATRPCDDCIVIRERLPRTPAQREAWQAHQQAEWEWNKQYDGRDFKNCLLKHGYDKCMGRAY